MSDSSPAADGKIAGKKSSGALLGVGALLLLTTGGLGYLTYDAQNQRNRVVVERDTANAQLKGLQNNEKLSAARIAELVRDNDERAELLGETKRRLTEVNTELAALRIQLDEVSQEQSLAQEQLAEFKQMTSQLQKMIDSGRLQVTFRRGRMIVELPAQVLFPSGSADLTEQGKEAIVEVAKILRGMRDRRFIVAGHTDNVPLVKDKFASNWELSSARAVTVTHALVRGGLKPEQLVAAGYSEYDPVARNNNEKNKQKNRRIELVLEPRLKPLPDLDKVAKK